MMYQAPVMEQVSLAKLNEYLTVAEATTYLGRSTVDGALPKGRWLKLERHATPVEAALEARAFDTRERAAP